MIHITTGCRFVCSLSWQNRGHTSSLIATEEKKKKSGRGGGCHIAIPVALGCGAGHSGSVLEESHGSDG